MLFADMIKGLSITIKKFFGPSVTLHYPIERRETPERMRFLHKLTLNSAGRPKCIACGICERACPPKCIKITRGTREDGKKGLTGYELDIGRCIFCGLCVEVCPEEAISMTGIYELATYNRADTVYTMDRLVRDVPEEKKAGVR
ncbi:MAG: NADH-quinone oxidoreductase subunit I [Deltaproteobacteria bacterium]|nr:NADH-quinone oxidoreductase subunit I [Candidatus Tharpellaceae bacterium]